MEIYPSGGWTYSLVNYGGTWNLVDHATGVSLAGTSDGDNVTLCLPDGCYEISGNYGSGSSYGALTADFEIGALVANGTQAQTINSKTVIDTDKDGICDEEEEMTKEDMQAWLEEGNNPDEFKWPRE